MPTTKTYSGKKFVPLMLAGFVVFTAVGLLLTYVAATAMTPYFEHRLEHQAQSGHLTTSDGVKVSP
jgi:hypothetical protein